MRACTPYLLYQIVRFGSLTIGELRALCEGRHSRTDIYEGLKAMIRAKLIVRIAYPNTKSPVYKPTEAGVIAAMGRPVGHTRMSREGDETHSLRVAQTLIALSKYENVTGIGTEFEIPLEQWKEFSCSKIPDGLIQVTRDQLNYELAVEVEVTTKTWERSDDFLNRYQEAFVQQAGCSGVILVCDTSDAFNHYDSLLQKKGETLSKRFLLIRGPELGSLNPKLYGELRKTPGFCAERRRASFSDGIRYLPMKFSSQASDAGQLPPNKDPLLGKSKIEEELQPISQ